MQKITILKPIVFLTFFFIAWQLLFVWLNILSNNMLETIVSSSIALSYLKSTIIMRQLIFFILAQIFLYTLFIWIIWYIALSTGELFHWQNKHTRFFGILLWMITIIGVMTANCYYFPTSFFSDLISKHLLNNHISLLTYKIASFLMFFLLSVASIFALMNSFHKMYWKKNLIRHSLMLGFLLMIVVVHFMPRFHSSIKLQTTSSYPNIIIIGFDALRPDFIGSQNTFNTMTPHLNDFLKTSVHFTQAFTPLARTTPSWTTILTGRYPQHTFSSGNNISTSLLDLSETLPKKLKNIGYETIYATDDRRYNGINKNYGFDQVIGPSTGVNDFILGTFNDFPLSNLIVPTWLGKILFPFNYANHGDNITYRANNFLDLIQENVKPSKKPLFFAVHFNLTGWPFYCYRPNALPDEDVVNNYKNCVNEADEVFSHFLTWLEQEGLLKKTIVILLSDHGVALGLPHDRVISLEKYHGNSVFIKKIPIVKYHNTPTFNFDFIHDYGIDASFGYGGDILSLKQTKTILAIKEYGLGVTSPYDVNDYVSLLDITPTLLDLLMIPPLNDNDGTSLKPYLLNSSMQPSKLQRIFYFETSFSTPEIETDRIIINKLLKKVIYLYSLDPQTGEIFINPNLLPAITRQKQHATLKNNMLRAYMPSHSILKVEWDKQARKKKMAYVTTPGYQVLVNLQTGQWHIYPDATGI